MKKAGLLFLTLILCGCLTAGAESLTGIVTAVSGEGLTLLTREAEHFIPVSADTVWDTDEEIGPGDAAAVYFDGYSEEGNAAADSVVCHRIRGTVLETADVPEPHLILKPDDGGETVRVNLADIPAYTAVPGMAATVYYNGIETRSVPPQITALYLRGTVLDGRIAAAAENGDIELIREDGETAVVHIAPDTLCPPGLKAGDAVRVSVLPQMTLSVPAQYTAQDIIVIDEQKGRDRS